MFSTSSHLLEEAAEGYGAMGERRAIKVLLRRTQPSGLASLLTDVGREEAGDGVHHLVGLVWVVACALNDPRLRAGIPAASCSWCSGGNSQSSRSDEVEQVGVIGLSARGEPLVDRARTTQGDEQATWLRSRLDWRTCLRRRRLGCRISAAERRAVGAIRAADQRPWEAHCQFNGDCGDQSAVSNDASTW